MKKFAVAIFSHHTGEITQFIRYDHNERELCGELYQERLKEIAPPEYSIEDIYESFFNCDEVLSILEIT